MKTRWAVNVIDIQGDFTEWKNGSLSVPGTGEPFVIETEDATRRLKEAGLVIFGTQDWHPSDHISFAVNHPGMKPFDVITINGRSQVLWPPHCVQGTENARVLVDNNLFLAIVRKGQNAAFESYSGFHDEGEIKTEMDSILRRNDIGGLVIYGVATEYCVRATALDAVAAGFRVMVIKDLCRGITPDGSAHAFEEMSRKGAELTETVDEVLKRTR
jgi:nicotinamidase/pyrazinamidase